MQTLFRYSYSTYEGEPPRLYRSPDDIRRDIKVIKREIAEATASLNIRNLLTEAIASLAEAEPERWIPELRDLCDEADETLTALQSLREDLDLLREELEDARWMLEA